MSSFASCPEDIALDILWMLGLQKVGLMSMFTLISTNKAMRVAWTPFLRKILPFCPDAFLCTTRLLVGGGERSVFDAAISKILPSEWGYYSSDSPNSERWDDLMDVMHDEIFPMFIVTAAFHDNLEVVKCMVDVDFGFYDEPDKRLRFASKGYLRRTILRGDLDSALKACGKDWYPFDLFGKDSCDKFVYERPHATPSFPFEQAPPSFVDVRGYDIIFWLLGMAEILAFKLTYDETIDHVEWAMRNVPSDAKELSAKRLLQVATRLISDLFWFESRNVDPFMVFSRFKKLQLQPEAVQNNSSAPLTEFAELQELILDCTLF